MNSPSSRDNQPNPSDPKRGLGFIRWSFLGLNLYYGVRLALALVNRSRILSPQSILALLLCLALSALLAGAMFRKDSSRFLGRILARKNLILEIFIYYLFSSQLLNWLSAHLTTAAAFEIRGWFVSNTLFLVFGCLLLKFLPLVPASPLVQPDQEASSPESAVRLRLAVGLLLILLPIAGYWVYTQWIAPLPGYFEYDPEYSYMLTAAAPFKEAGLYARLDHPGTLLQLAGSLLMVVLSPLTLPQAGFPAYLAVNQPGLFIGTARLVLLAASLGGAVFLAVRTIRSRRTTDILAGLSVPLFYFSAHRLALEFTGVWSPNAFNFIAGSLILFFLLQALSREKPDPEKYLLVSLAAGAVATFHVYLITLGLAVFSAIFLYHLIAGSGLKKALLEVGKSLLNFLKGYLLGFLVVFDQFKSFLDWLYQVLFHTGYYGQGKAGLIDPNQASLAVRTILQSYPELVLATGLLLVLALGLLIAAGKKIGQKPGTWAVLFGLALQLLLLLIVVLKQPRGRYLLSAAAIYPVFFAALVLLLRPYPRVTRFLYPALFLVLAALFVNNLSADLSAHQADLAYINTYQAEVDQALSQFAGDQGLDQGEIQKFYTYGSYSGCFALWFGNEYARDLFTDEIQEACSPDQEYAISIWSGKVLPDRTQRLADLGQNAIIIGEPGRIQELDPSLDLVYQSNKISDLAFFTPAQAP